MDLNTLWFILIGTLFTGFFILEGFDFGVGMLLPFVAKDDLDRRVVINTIGPVWDGNEVWLLTAGGAIFAAFPHWYATMFSGFYLALVLMLVGLILRGVGLEFRSKHESPTWRRNWDIVICASSALPALLIGVALTNLVIGVPIDGSKQFAGGFFDLLTPPAIMGGVVSLTLFLFHGASFLALKTTDELNKRVQKALHITLLVAFLMACLFTIVFRPNVSGVEATISVALRTSMLLTLFIGRNLVRRARFGWAFVASSLAVALFPISLFQSLFPNVMVSSLNRSFSLDIYNAASTPYTLQIMSIVAAIFVPIVLIYQGWTYWIFRKRITRNDQLHY
jgi:cytochrome d ubiquinol oxidase subunit II